MRDFKTVPSTDVSGLANADPITFTIDGEEITAYPPKDGQMLLFMAAQAEGANPSSSVAAIIDFLNGILDDAGRSLVRRKLLDRNDPFGSVQIREIITWLFEEWSARPTGSPRGSTPSRLATGRKSTAKPRSTV